MTPMTPAIPIEALSPVGAPLRAVAAIPTVSPRIPTLARAGYV
jgi:hypothetical protein